MKRDNLKNKKVTKKKSRWSFFSDKIPNWSLKVNFCDRKKSWPQNRCEKTSPGMKALFEEHLVMNNEICRKMSLLKVTFCDKTGRDKKYH